MFNIIGKRKIYLVISGILLVAAVAVIGMFGFKPGIDFAGGTLWQVNFNESVKTREWQEWLIESGMESVIVTEISDGSLLARFQDIGEGEHQVLVATISQRFGEVEELAFQSIGPAVGAELKRGSIMAAILVLLGISLYVAFAFRHVSYPVASWKYGIVTLVTLFHDVVITAGWLAWLGYARGVELDTNLMVALMVVAGFSVHDTIVVFDRIRENIKKQKSGEKLEETINKSVIQTMARSINTSLTLVFILIALYFVGPVTLQVFVLTVLAGTIIGTYSSICIASPLLVVWYEVTENKK